jgi:choline-sulfatase
MAGVRAEERLPVDGRSVMGLLDGSDTEGWEAISEYHSQGVHAPCFMIRRGTFKYVYIHGHGAQLFDLAADPGEWNNLAGKPVYREIEEQLQGRTLELFDPDAIDKAVAGSVRRRALIKRAMQIAGTRWDVEPRFDPTKGIIDQYLPGTGLADIPR